METKKKDFITLTVPAFMLFYFQWDSFKKLKRTDLIS